MFLNNVGHIEELVEEINELVLREGDVVCDRPQIEISRIYYYVMISDSAGIESQMPTFLDKLGTIDNLIDYTQDINDLCFELMKYGQYHYVRQIIDVVFDKLVFCGVPAIAMVILELCITYYEITGEKEYLDEVKSLYYKVTLEKRAKDKIRIGNSIEFYENIVKIKLERNRVMRENARLERESNTDALTELPNRRMLNAMTESSFEAAFQNQTMLGFEILDIDFFKQINDSYGHQYGDECLKAIAKILKKITDEDERIFAARYGGDEFCIIYNNMTDEEILEVALKLRDDVIALKIPSKNSTVSE